MGLVPLLDKVAGVYRLAVPAPDLNVYTTRILNVSELDVTNAPVDDVVTARGGFPSTSACSYVPNTPVDDMVTV